MASSPPPSPAPDPAPAGGRMGEESTPQSDEHSWKRVFELIVERLGEIREYATYYLSTKTDAVKSSITWLLVYALLGIVAAIIGAAVLVTVGVLLITGIAGGLGQLFGYPWLGQLVTAVLMLGIIGVGAWIGMKMLRNTLTRKLMAKYEQRHEEQRRRFGADVLQRAAERQEQQAVG